MRLLFTLLSLLISYNLFPQFQHLEVSEISKEPSVLYFMDGSSKSGFIKNNPSKNIGLRLLSRMSDENALSNSETIVESILFKEDGSEEFSTFDVSVIDKVSFFIDEYEVVYKRVSYYEVNASKAKVERDELKTMFLLENNFTGFKHYRLSRYIYMNGVVLHVVLHSYFVKNPVLDEYYYFYFTYFTSRKSMLNYFRIFGSECPEYIEYINKLENKKSAEWKEFEEAKDNFHDEAKQFRKRKDITNEERLSNKTAVHYDFYMSFLGAKYKSFNCPGSDHLID